ncbi:FUSC family protein [Rhodococcus sp. HNM0569]|uniref:FUSC family protein n=1 Tax=Rhodococcus sp. HNM0569 TaxID=2716340 RepID=UPI00146D9D13|nr:aromatic acid exporter family protein [Rhodococcus sp. HNM0569]
MSALPILQCALAASLAWWVATALVGHQAPFFAPIAAIVSLGLSLGARMRRSVELVVGVTIGVGVGDLLIGVIGRGTWQIGLVIVLAMSAAVLLNSGALVAMQAGTSAVLVATLVPPGGIPGLERMVDALVGGAVGILVVALVPTHPVGRARLDAAGILRSASEVLALVADGLMAQNEKPIVEALAKARTTQKNIETLRDHVVGGREIARISPFYWRTRRRLERLTAAVDPIDNAMRNIRVLTRRSLTLVRDDEILDQRLVDEVEKLSHALQVLERMALADPGQQPDQAEAARVLRSVAAGLKPSIVENAGLSATVVFAQLRSLLVDLLQVAGLKRISAIATLPPTVEHPAYRPDL